jgi:predicted dehydrogenase
MLGKSLSRRDFLVSSSAVTASLFLPGFVHAQGSESLKVGVIGCGGRGTGAANDAARAYPGAVIWAMGDVFPERLEGSRKQLSERLKEQYNVSDDRAFSGFDAYQKVIDSGVDVVILASPPGFRPAHFEAAIAANKHVFTEKPVAVDGPGIRRFMAAADESKRKNLAVVAGTQRRHDPAYREVMKRVHGGEIGEVVAMNCYWNQGGLWMHERQAQWSDMEWQLRNWLYFTWLSGDIIVEQHIHNIDVCNWAMGKHPVKAISLAGRQARTSPTYGMVYDHFATEYEYDNGVKMVSMCRQIDGCANRVSENVVGSRGRSVTWDGGNTMTMGAEEWSYEGERVNPYVQEHVHLFNSIRQGAPINEAHQVGESTLSAIMGRMAGYSGREITWEQAMNSSEDTMPEQLAFGPLAVAPVSIPGRSVFR